MKIAMLCHLSPPVHGAALMGDIVVRTLSKITNLDVRRLSATRNLGGIGRMNLRGFFYLIGHFPWLLYQICIRRVSLLYYTPALDGNAWYRDGVVILWIKVLRRVSFINCRIILHVHMRPKLGRSSTKLWHAVVSRTELILLSPSLREDFEHIPASTRIHFLANCADLPNTDLLKKGDSINLLYLGHISESKGILFLLDALALALASNEQFRTFFDIHPFTLTLAGTLLLSHETLDTKLRGLEKLGMKCVLKGPVYGSEKSDLFSKASLFLHPSFSEALPLTLIEAYSYGVPVLARKIGGMRDMVFPESGLLFSNESQMISGIMKVVEGNYDRDEIRRIYSENFSPELFSKGLKSIVSL